MSEQGYLLVLLEVLLSVLHKCSEKPTDRQQILPDSPIFDLFSGSVIKIVNKF